MTKDTLKKLIAAARKTRDADLVLKNCNVVNVFTGEIVPADIAVCEGYIAGVGAYDRAAAFIDCEGRFAAPGLIDAHVHIESSHLSPEEFSRLVVPFGTTTLMADPHETANVLGLRGLGYMAVAGKQAGADIRWMMPSCVPAAAHEISGAVISASDMRGPLSSGLFAGLGEFMDVPAVLEGRDDALDKLTAAFSRRLPVDGHAPGLSGDDLTAYAAAGISTDHECTEPEELTERVARGMYVLLREGSACSNLRALLKAVTPQNAFRCLFCTDDSRPDTVLTHGHLNRHLRIAVREGLDPVTALRMATLNAAECYGLRDRGALAPGRRADIVLFDDLKDFRAERVFVLGREAARSGRCLFTSPEQNIHSVQNSFKVKDFGIEKLALPLSGEEARVIDVVPGGVRTRSAVRAVRRDERGRFVFSEDVDAVKIAVVERHRNTGNVGVGLLGGYGLKRGAAALSVAHDSHNILAVGTRDEDMALAVSELLAMDGGIAITENGRVTERLPMPIAGLMSDLPAEQVAALLARITERLHRMGVPADVDPITTLSFMALTVIPELKITDRGLFDVCAGRFVPVSVGAEESGIPPEDSEPAPQTVTDEPELRTEDSAANPPAQAQAPAPQLPEEGLSPEPTDEAANEPEADPAPAPESRSETAPETEEA